MLHLDNVRLAAQVHDPGLLWHAHGGRTPPYSASGGHIDFSVSAVEGYVCPAKRIPTYDVAILEKRILCRIVYLKHCSAWSIYL
jgi:hypothetical protein